jgi:hypothetical protein
MRELRATVEVDPAVGINHDADSSTASGGPDLQGLQVHAVSRADRLGYSAQMIAEEVVARAAHPENLLAVELSMGPSAVAGPPRDGQRTPGVA